MGGTVVRSTRYPSPDQFDDDVVGEYGILSRYEGAADRLEQSSLTLDRIEPAPASSDDLRRCCSERRLRQVFGSPPTVSPDRLDPGPWAEALAVGGTLEATDGALDDGTAVHLGGGFHHAHRGGSSARTVCNDIVAAVEYARQEAGIDRIAVVDLDVHHHDGTRAAYRLDGDCYLFSMHGWNLFPGTGWLHETGRGHAAGNHLNVPLPAGTDGQSYIAVLERLLPPWIRHVDPELTIYVAGADVHTADPTGNLDLSVTDSYARDRVVVDHTRQAPLVVVTGGGYGPAAPAIHANTVAAAFGDGPIRDPEPSPADRAALETRVTLRRWLSSLVDHYERQHPEVASL